MNKKIIEVIKTAKSFKDLKKAANKNGYPLSDEEAKNYFNIYHAKGKIGETELDNVAGGSCSTYSSDGRESDGRHRLIVVPGFNDCSLFENSLKNLSFVVDCENCKHMTTEGSTHYCEARTLEYDPINN